MYTNVSDDFLSAVNGAEPVYCCKLDFGNNVTVNDLFSVSYSGGSCSESIVPGGTVIANAKVELSALPASVRKGSACTLYFGVNGEYAPQGVLTVKKIEKSGELLSVTLEDNMTKTEKGYFSSLSYPSTTLKMLSEIATKCGVAFNTSGLTAVTIKDKPEGYTCREIIGYIAGLYGKFAVCDRTGKIAFKWFDTTAVQLSDFCYDTPTVATDDSTVGRVVCGDFTAGTGTAITYDCLFMTQNQLNTVQKSLNGFKYRTGEIPLRLGNMLIDAWDMVSITYGGETVKIPAATISVAYNGGLSMTIEAPAEEQSADSGESYKSPAQKQAERITADIISVKQALLEKADIAELNAQIANLENVYAAKADITELSAQIATIDNLTAKKADVEQLYAKKADIDELVADTATLKSLKSNVANIDVLLSGKAGTGELTSIKLTAENAEIATALIKDLTAANFRSKTIETDDFTIKSSSGKLQIVGNTIQIKDVNNTVRVQIGEDGKSDYGIYVTDAGGKIMFTSYDGLHEDGIKSGIIKNDMVADDAHISGSKLDISSVIDGINADNSTYLNTSKVVIDGTSQTINAKFTELTASIGSIGTRTSALESDLSGFRTTVSETYATKSAVDGIQIGGRNLLYDSTGNIKNGWSGTTVVNVGGGISGNSLSVSRTGYSGNARYFGTNKRHFLTDFNVGTSYTLSAWIKVGSNVELDASGYVMARFRSADDKKLYALSLTVSSQTEKDKWLYYEKTWTINDSDIAKLECVALALDKNGMIEACNIKLEKGTKATDWSPAPEDTTAEITSLSSKQASLEQTVDGFKATVESTYATKSSLSGYPTITQMNSAIDQKAGSITTTVSQQIAEIAVGGRNIITGSAKLTIGAGKRPKGHWRTSGSVATVSAPVIGVPYADDLTACVLTATAVNTDGGIVQDGVLLNKDEYYTLSCWVRNSSAKSVKCVLQPFWKSSTDASGKKEFTLTASSDWQRLSFTSTKKPAVNDNYAAGYVFVNADTVGTSIQICGVKLETGTKATDWSPAPEDTDSSISEVKQTADKISWLVKSGTSASSMKLTSEALKIIADTEIKGDVIVGGVIKSADYSEFIRGSKWDLSNGAFYAQSSTGLITLSDGQINLELLENGVRTATATSIYPLFGGTAISNSLGELYLIAESRGSAALHKNRDCYVMFNESGMVTANGSYTNSRDTDGNIVRLVALTTANHFHVGSTDISGTTRLICGNRNKIEFCRPSDNNAITPMASLSYSNTIVRLYMPLHFDLGTDGAHACVRQQTTGVTSADFVKIGNSTQLLQLIGKTITSTKAITTSSDARMKNHIADLPSKSENLFDYLDGKSFFYNGDNSTAKNYGFIAQDVLTALQKCGLTTDDFAGFCDINGDGSQYALAYEQFIPLMWNEIKRLRKALSERS